MPVRVGLLPIYIIKCFTVQPAYKRSKLCDTYSLTYIWNNLKLNHSKVYHRVWITQANKAYIDREIVQHITNLFSAFDHLSLGASIPNLLVWFFGGVFFFFKKNY